MRTEQSYKNIQTKIKLSLKKKEFYLNTIFQLKLWSFYAIEYFQYARSSFNDDQVPKYQQCHNSIQNR